MLENAVNLNSQVKEYSVKQMEKTPPVNETLGKQGDHFQKEASKEKTEKVINSMNDFLKASNTHLKFQFHEKLQEYYVSIVDNTTDEVIKDIPSKKLLDMYAEMTEFLGHLVDKRV